jgi:hypothetical protein
MNAEIEKLKPPQPRDFGLDEADVPREGLETITMGDLAIPKRLSPALNWGLGLSVAVPLAVWTLYGLIIRIDSLALGMTVGLLAGIIVFQLAVSVVPLSIDVALHGVGLLVDEIGAHFSEKARARIAYRKALKTYRNELARGGFDR